MNIISKLSVEKIAFLFVCLLPITIILGQAALSLNYFIISIFFFLLLINYQFRLLLKHHLIYITLFYCFNNNTNNKFKR